MRRIPNWLIAIGLSVGVVLSAFQGIGQLVQSMLGFSVGIAVLLIPFALGWIGAGDVKYLGVIGALLGVAWLPRVFFYSALAAGAISIVDLTARSGHLSQFKESWTDFKIALMSMGSVLPKPVHVRSNARGGSIPWGVALAAGTIFAYYFDHNGQLAGF
jgi:prepilin peptidase CpaA